MHEHDAQKLAQARSWLDDESAALDDVTLAALARARRHAQQPTPSRWRGWQAGGVLLAAALAWVMLLPGDSPDPGTPWTDDDMLLLLSSHDDLAMAEELTFLLWLEENHDAG